MQDTKYIQKFQDLYKKRFGEEISSQKALSIFTNLVELTRAIYKPLKIKKEKNEKNIEK